jgi:hypothetical protein
MKIPRSLSGAVILAILVAAGCCLVGCTKLQPRAVGEDDEIIVFADSAEWSVYQSDLSNALEQTLFTPQPEKMFHLVRTPIEKFDDFRNRRNILVVASIDGEGEAAGLLRSSLHPDVQQILREGKEFVINKYDVHGRGQIMMFLSSTGLEALRDRIRKSAGQLFYFFENAWVKREVASLFSEKKYEKKDIEKSLIKNHQWRIFVQHDYWVAQDSAEARFVWLRRTNPSDMERWLFVHWIDSADPGALTPTFCFDLRNKLTQAFYRTFEDTVHVRIADDPMSLQTYHIGETNFLGRYGYEMQGLWQFSDMSGGGPFVSYVFYDESSKRIFMIDGSVFAPRYSKKELIVQLRAIVQTFQTAADLTEEQPEELTD